MQTATGTILMVQESRFRLLTDAGQGLAFVLSSSAPFEPQDLLPLAGRRARVDYRATPGLLAGEAHDIALLDA